MDRDRTDRDDTVEIFFDPFLDQLRAYVFSVNGYGVQGDRLITNQPRNPTGAVGPAQGDTSWDALLVSAGTPVPDGIAELAIPFKSLRYPARGQGEAHRWGLQIQRQIRSKNETVLWAPVSRDDPGFLRQMGVLDGMVDLSTSRNLELLPTVTAVHVGNLASSTGSFVTQDVQEGGVGLKYGITPNLTLDEPGSTCSSRTTCP